MTDGDCGAVGRPGRDTASAFLGGLALFVAAAAPADGGARERSAHVGIFGGVWAHANLLDLPAQAATGALEFKDQHVVGLAFSKVLIRDLPSLGPMPGGGSVELEGQLVQHLGVMDHPEVTGAIAWRSPDLTLPGGAGVNLAGGIGLSYAFDEPHLEGARKGRDVQRLLGYLFLEAEFSHAALPGIHLVPRLHHRSGVFDLIGPKGDGANYLGLGLRIDLPPPAAVNRRERSRDPRPRPGPSRGGARPSEPGRRPSGGAPRRDVGPVRATRALPHGWAGRGERAAGCGPIGEI